MKTQHQLVSEKDLTGRINFTPEFTKSEKSTLKRFGFAPLPGSSFLHSSQGKWIEKIECVDYVVKHEGTNLKGVTETSRILTYFLVETRPGSYSGLTSTIAEDTDFKSFVKKIKTMHDLDKKN